MKDRINHFLRGFGYEVRKGPISVSGLQVEPDFFKKNAWIKNKGFQTILDIGANQGQFAGRFRLLFPNAHIYSFEPIPEVYLALCRKFDKDPHFTAFNLGLGDIPGLFDFYLNQFPDSSSLLPMKSLHIEIFPFTQHSSQIKIKVETLDRLATNLPLQGPLLVKIDVQGFEKKVILGGLETIKKASMVMVEVSYQELYENQNSFEDIFSLLKDLGFAFVGNYDQLLSPKDCSILQADAIFVNHSLCSELN